MKNQKTAPVVYARMATATPVILSLVVGGTLMSVISVYAPRPLQTTVLGTLTCVPIGFLFSMLARLQKTAERQYRLLWSLRAPVTLTKEPDLFYVHDDLAQSLIRLAKQTDDVLREIALVKLFAAAEEIHDLSEGRVTFTATESWREAYQRILQAGGTDRYQSVAWIRSEDYWRDIPGERSLRTNLELRQQGMEIERILIICDFLWPPGARLPSSEIRKWIDCQYEQGINIQLVRESDLLSESDLLLDFGIYGDRATGILMLDEQARTQRFELYFDRQSIELAQDRWKRLRLFTVSYGSLLDRIRVCH